MPDYDNRVTMGLTWDSTADEVIAADEHERRTKASLTEIELERDLLGCPARRHPDRPLTGDKLLLERQKTAGEEDQSVPGWDQGA